MGREAECACEWSGESTQVNALLESGELILRGGLRRRIPFARIAHVQVDHDKLAFTVDFDQTELPAILKGLDAICEAFPVVGSPTGEKRSRV